MAKRKRQTHQPIGFTEEEMTGSFMASRQHMEIAITNRLTGTQMRLWMYLMMLNSDQPPSHDPISIPLPTPAEIALKIGASQRTVEKDLKRLQEVGLCELE